MSKEGGRKRRKTDYSRITWRGWKAETEEEDDFKMFIWNYRKLRTQNYKLKADVENNSPKVAIDLKFNRSLLYMINPLCTEL